MSKMQPINPIQLPSLTKVPKIRGLVINTKITEPTANEEIIIKKLNEIIALLNSQEDFTGELSGDKNESEIS